jgi:hypothetical protein
MSEFQEWDSFYIIVGSAAGALIGLQFVVMTLIAERPALRRPEAARAFATPTIIHFAAVLFLAALLRAPWKVITPAAVSWGIVGILGAGYIIVVPRRIGLQTVYRPDFEDWLFNAILTFMAYATLAASAVAAGYYTSIALFPVGGATLLLFVGIHNAWDAVAYHVLVRKGHTNGDEH